MKQEKTWEEFRRNSRGEGSGSSDTGTIAAFSDGVCASAIMLRVIEIGEPHLENEPEGTTLFGALLDLRPLYLGYVISFLVTGTVWANHNRVSYIVRSDHVLLVQTPCS